MSQNCTYIHIHEREHASNGQNKMGIWSLTAVNTKSLRSSACLTSAEADILLLGDKGPIWLWLDRLFDPSKDWPLKEPPVLTGLSGTPTCRLVRWRGWGWGGYCRSRAGGRRQQGHSQSGVSCTLCKLSAVKRHKHLRPGTLHHYLMLILPADLTDQKRSKRKVHAVKPFIIGGSALSCAQGQRFERNCFFQISKQG